MLLFTPHNPYLDFNPVYSMVINIFNYFIFVFEINNEIICFVLVAITEH